MTLRFPHPLVLLLIFVALAAVGTWVVPAGQFERRQDPVTEREVVVAGTYHAVERAPVGPFASLLAIPRGMADAASVTFFVFLVGGAFAVVEKTGALEQAVNWLVSKLENRAAAAIPICCIAFGTGGALMQMAEELIAFVPVLLLLSRRLGFNALTAVAMSMGASAVAASFSPVDPFMAIVAQKVAGVTVMSGWQFRLAFTAAALLLWIVLLMQYARRTRTTPEGAPADQLAGLDARRGTVLLLVVASFVMLVIGLQRLGW